MIEMLVSVGIFTVISGIVLVNYNGFNSKILLSNLTYDVALSIRQAQAYSKGVRELGGVTQRHYGIFLDEGSAPSADGSTDFYVLFVDIAPLQTYDKTPPYTDCTDAECLERYRIFRGNKIKQFCIWQGATSICSPDGGAGGSLQSLSIIFRRPNPEARFFPVFDSGSMVAPDRVTIEVSNPAGTDIKTITILNTGQISVI